MKTKCTFVLVLMILKIVAYFILIKVLKYMRDSGIMVWCMEKVHVFIRMEISLMKVNGN